MIPRSEPQAAQNELIGNVLAKFENVGKTFNSDTEGEVEAVQNINLEIFKGEVLTILGPSGCGKSTLLNMLAGIFPASTGEVQYRGKPVKGINTRTGYMTQNDHLLPWRNIAQNIRAPLEVKGVRRREASDRVNELLTIVSLGDFADAYPSQVSGGMRKRAALARLLAYDPETLLLDEPFVALDAQLRLAMQSELRALCLQLGKTVLFVTHDVDEAVGLGDRCIVFTKRPGTIARIVDIDLPKNRDLLAIRRDPQFSALTSELWDHMAQVKPRGSMGGTMPTEALQ